MVTKNKLVIVSQLCLFLSYDGFPESCDKIKREFPFHLHHFPRNLHLIQNVVQGLLVGESMVRTDIII